jgi:hypothetical protein
MPSELFRKYQENPRDFALITGYLGHEAKKQKQAHPGVPDRDKVLEEEFRKAREKALSERGTSV